MDGNKPFIIAISVLGVLIFGLTVGNILLITRRSDDNNQTVSEQTPVIEKNYAENLQEHINTTYEEDNTSIPKIMSECMDNTKDSDLSQQYSVALTCSEFMLEHEQYENTISILDTLNTSSYSDEELASIYKKYSAAHYGLGNQEKGKEYDAQYQNIKTEMEKWS